MEEIPDAIVIGSGVGGGTVARRLAEGGAQVLMLERGGWIPREDDNWSVESVFLAKRYTAHDTWLDSDGTPFRPNIFYNVGGCTKFYGAAMIRLRERDFEVLAHAEGESSSWPIRYADLEPYYCEAETIFGVHGDDAGDPTAPWRSRPYPAPELASEARVTEMAERMRAVGARTSALPLAVDYGREGHCIRCKTCDGFPCKVGAKNEAETCLVRPALRTGRFSILTHTYARRLLLSLDGANIAGVEVERDGRVEVLAAKLIVVACGAVNSAALLLRSAGPKAEHGVANGSGVVGRYYMCHNQAALMGLGLERNNTTFQKTLALNEYYFGEADYRFPMGQGQMLGKLQGGMLSANVPFLPRSFSANMARHSMDWLVLSEDLPNPDNRVVLRDGKIQLYVKRNNLSSHRRLVDRLRALLREAGYPIVLTKPLLRHSTSHQCGTVRFGTDPGTSALDPYCRSYQHRNLFVVDASFMPSSAAVNPALTIAAQALRVADHMLQEDFGIARQHGAAPIGWSAPAATPPHE